MKLSEYVAKRLMENVETEGVVRMSIGGEEIVIEPEPVAELKPAVEDTEPEPVVAEPEPAVEDAEPEEDAEDEAKADDAEQ